MRPTIGAARRDEACRAVRPASERGHTKKKDASMSVKIIAFVTVKPGSEDAFVDAARICVAASRAEPGVLHYDLWREADGERRILIVRGSW